MSPPAPPQSRAKTVLVQLFTGLMTVVGLILAGTFVYGLFTLPGCDDRRVRDTLRTLFQNNHVSADSGFEEARETSRSSEVVACTRLVNTPEGRLDLTYRITKTGLGRNQVEATWRRL